MNYLKGFRFKDLLFGIVIITVLVLVGIGIAYKVNSKGITQINNKKVTSISIKLMPSSPKQKVIDNKNDIDKIIKHINSIKVKEKKQEPYKGWEINISILGEENCDISFVGEYINVNGTQYRVSKDEIEKLRRLYDSLNYDETYVLDKTDEKLNYTSLIKGLINNNLKIEEIDKRTSAAKDNGYCANIYNLKINDEDLLVYEYNDTKAALSEANLINEDSLRQIYYSDEDMIIDRLKLLSINNAYLKVNLVCLYDGDSTEIKEGLQSLLGEPLIKQSKDQLVISDNSVILRYPANWDYYQTPKEILIGKDSYKADTRFIKVNKNICEVPIERDDLIHKMRKFDEDELNVNWISKIDSNNKEFLTKIARDDFIRVSRLGNTYVDINKVYPEIEIDSIDKTLIGKKLYEEYIKMHTTNWRFLLANNIKKEPEVTVLDSKVSDVSLVEEGKNVFTVSISYDIKTANENSPWLAGTGVTEEDNWIRHKIHIADIEKVGENRYRIINLYN
ncbi:hypothetical protein UT300007_03860 [Clostridium sp. CTA-7]